MPKWPQQNVSPGKDAPRRVSPWHAVSIVLGNSCCGPARDASRTRFLSTAAPRLPLAQCTTPENCRCAYKHHSDRRVQPRRRDELVGLRRTGHVAQERRTMRGRREDDMI